MSGKPSGQIGTSYREKSRWVAVRNDSDYEIPAYAPCFFILRADLKDEDQPIVLPFTGLNQQETRGIAAVSPANYSMCVNGPSPIPSKGFGEVTIDYPCVARVKHFENRLNDPVKKYDSFAAVYVDLNSTARGKAVSYFSDIGNESLSYRLLPNAGFYRNATLAFQTIAVANEKEDLYWIVPKERPASGDNASSGFVGYNDSQDVVSEFPFNEPGGSQDWAVWEDGDIVINLPGVYSLSVYMLVYEGGVLEDQETTLPTDYRLTFETESLSERLATAAFGVDTLAIRQPSHLYKINCSGGYGVCPTMDVYRPSVSAVRSTILTVTVDDKWKVPTSDGKVKAVPLVKVSASRTVNFDHTADISPLYVEVNVTRGGFEDFYRHGYYGGWGWWGYFGGGYGFGFGGEEYIG